MREHINVFKKCVTTYKIWAEFFNVILLLSNTIRKYVSYYPSIDDTRRYQTKDYEIYQSTAKNWLVNTV